MPCSLLIYLDTDEFLDLDSLLIKLRGKVTTQWYQLGLAIGIPDESLKKLEGYSEEECLVELLDYWLRCHPGQPSWKELADAIEGIRDNQLANSIMSVYDSAG